MSHPATNGHSNYYNAITAEDERLAAVIAAINADLAAGHLTVCQAADNRIAAMEAHLAKCQELRRRYLGE